MKTILKDISILAIQLSEAKFSEQQKRLMWLGRAPASEKEIKQVEQRLGVEFPDDYKNFLYITNGFFTPSDPTEPTFETIDKVDYLKNTDTFLLEIWNQSPLTDVGRQLSNAIVVGGINDEQYFFLIPPDNSDNKWRYWKFASWIPGEHRYEDLENYFRSVLDFINDLRQNSNE